MDVRAWGICANRKTAWKVLATHPQRDIFPCVAPGIATDAIFKSKCASDSSAVSHTLEIRAASSSICDSRTNDVSHIVGSAIVPLKIASYLVPHASLRKSSRCLCRGTRSTKQKSCFDLPRDGRLSRRLQRQYMNPYAANRAGTNGPHPFISPNAYRHANRMPCAWRGVSGVLRLSPTMKSVLPDMKPMI